jgi:UrcA family protein
MTVKIVLGCTLLAVSAGLPNAVAFASEFGDAPATRLVSFAGLDLTHEAGAAALYARIKSAARDVCKPRFDDLALEHVVSTRFCVEDAIVRAIADVNSPALTSYYLMKTRRPITIAQQR